MPTLVIRAVPAGGAAPDLERAARELFAALDRRQPDGLAYYSLRQDDGSYLIVVQFSDGAPNPLLSFNEFRSFQAGLQTWLTEPAITSPTQVVGAYGRLADPGSA